MTISQPYFVLEPKGNTLHAKASRIAMVCYAKTIMHENPQLFADLMSWAANENHEAEKRRRKDD